MVAAQRLVDRFQDRERTGQGRPSRWPRTCRSARTHRRSGAAAFSSVAKSIRPEDPIRLMQSQNRELLTSLAAERERQEDLPRLNQELEETNRGVVALYAELDEKAEYLRRASDLKSRFLSHMSHEFRTPLSSILALVAPAAGPDRRTARGGAAEAGRPISGKSAESLLELINDLLDIAKVEAGKLSVNCSSFALSDLFGGVARRPAPADDPRHRLDRLRGAGRHARPLYRRGQGRADPAQLHRQRDPLHRSRQHHGHQPAITPIAISMNFRSRIPASALRPRTRP